jgi:hypothetical protein
LIEAMPNGAGVLAPYASAKTISQIKSANTHFRKEIMQGRLVEMDLGKIHLVAMQSCEIADQIDRGQIDAIADKARAFKDVADDVDGRIRKSIAEMKRLLDRPGAGTYRLKHDTDEYEAAYAEFAQLRLEIQEVVKGLDKLAAAMPEAKDICRPSAIPPLINDKHKLKTGAPKPRSPRPPLNILNPHL